MPTRARSSSNQARRHSVATILAACERHWTFEGRSAFAVVAIAQRLRTCLGMMIVRQARELGFQAIGPLRFTPVAYQPLSMALCAARTAPVVPNPIVSPGEIGLPFASPRVIVADLSSVAGRRGPKMEKALILDSGALCTRNCHWVFLVSPSTLATRFAKHAAFRPSMTSAWRVEQASLQKWCSEHNAEITDHLVIGRRRVQPPLGHRAGHARVVRPQAPITGPGLLGRRAITSVPAIVRILGGASVFGSEPASEIELLQVVRRGVPVAALLHVAKRFARYPSAGTTIARMAGGNVPSNLKPSPRRLLSPISSDRLVRLGRIIALAESVLGHPERATSWLANPNAALGRHTPLSLLDTEIGAMQVEAVLGRVSHGIVS